MPLQSANIPSIITLDQWKGLNQQSGITTIPDQACFWLENYFPIGPGQLRSGYGPSAPIWTAPSGTTILRIFFMNITTDYPIGLLFLSDGTVWQVGLQDGVGVSLGQIWEPIAPDYWAAAKLWIPNQFGNVPGQTGGAFIGSPQGLYAWDGQTVTLPGQTPPLWATNSQTVDVNGNPLVMPVGLPGIYDLEVYKERLWVMGQTVISFSAPNNAIDFSAAGGGGSFPYHGDQLTSSYTTLEASSGFLYVFSDSSTNNITDLSLVSSQAGAGEVSTITIQTAQFQFSNINPQVGQAFSRRVGVWDQTFAMVTRGAGFYTVAGSEFTWITDTIINLVATLDISGFFPTQCPATIFGQRWMLFNGRFQDIDGNYRSMILCWSGPQFNQWVVASQNLELTHIGEYEEGSTITAYGTDGNALYALFNRPDPALEKRLMSKGYTGANFLTIKDWKRLYCEMIDEIGGPDNVSITGTVYTRDGGIPNGQEDIGFDIEPKGKAIVPAPLVGKGISAYYDLKSLSPDFVIARISLTFEERQLYGA